VAQHGRKLVKAKARLVPPLFRLVIDSKIQNPFLELLLPGHRTTNTAAFIAEFNDLLKSGHSLGLTESTLIEVDEYHLPPLHWSAVLGCTIAVQELLKNGYNPVLKVQDSGRTALHCVALYGPMARSHVNDTERVFKKIVPLLSDCLYVQDTELATPFHLVALGMTGDNRTKLYETLLYIFLKQLEDNPERGRNVLNVQDRQGNTMLHYLVESSLVSETILIKLLSYGISCKIQNKGGQTAVDVSHNKLVTDIFNPEQSMETVTESSHDPRKNPNPKRSKVRIASQFQSNRVSRMRRKPSRYDPTFHDEVPKFLQLELTKSKRVRQKPDKEKKEDDMDASSSTQSNADEAANDKHAVAREPVSPSSSSLQSVQKTSVDVQQRDLGKSSDLAKSSSHAGLSHQQLLPLLESLVACGLWEQLTDLATRMKQELEQEKRSYRQKLEVTAMNAGKVHENLKRCSSEMEKLRKEVGSLHRADSQLNEQKQGICGKIREIDEKITKLDCFVKKATSTV
jgi:ankyrin repeat protein